MTRPITSLASLLLVSLATFTVSSPCTAAGDWNGKSAAIALTYDDALNVHLDTVVPALDRHGFKGTFYITVGFDPYPQRLEQWRQVAADGHELGNHTLFHPCNAQAPGRDWVSADRDLSTWTVERMAAHIKVANTALEGLDGKTERTLAYPCGDTQAGGESYIEAVAPLFVGARGVTSGYPTPGAVKPFNIAAHMLSGQDIEQLKAMVDTAIERGGLLVFLFHGVGGEHGLNIEADTHAQLLDYLSRKRDQLWVAPMVDIARFVRQPRQR